MGPESEHTSHDDVPPGAFMFTSEPLDMAGTYVATAEYTEHRAELVEATHTGRGGLSCNRPVEIQVGPDCRLAASAAACYNATC